jgi:aminotransferase
MADITPFGWDDDVAFAMYLASEIGVATVPGSSFYCAGHPDGKKLIRFCFCKEFSTLEAAVERLKGLKRPE